MGLHYQLSLDSHRLFPPLKSAIQLLVVFFHLQSACQSDFYTYLTKIEVPRMNYLHIRPMAMLFLDQQKV